MNTPMTVAQMKAALAVNNGAPTVRNNSPISQRAGVALVHGAFNAYGSGRIFADAVSTTWRFRMMQLEQQRAAEEAAAK